MSTRCVSVLNISYFLLVSDDEPNLGYEDTPAYRLCISAEMYSANWRLD